VDSDQHGLAEVVAGPVTHGRPLSAVRNERLGLVLGLVRDGKVIMGIGNDRVIADGDHLLVIEKARTP
jgi:hypothetical protein